MTRNRGLLMLVTGVLLATMTGLSPANGVSFGLNSVVSANPVNNTPNVQQNSSGNATVWAIAEVDGIVYVGGRFSTVRNAGSSTNVPRQNLFAYNRASGQIVTGFNPAPNGFVESIAPGPNGTIVVGGRFTTIAGGSQRSIAMLTASGARVTGFTGRTNGTVSKVVVRGNRLIAAGRFGTAGASGGNVSRSNLAAFNLTTNAMDGLNVPVTVGRTRNGASTTASVTEMDANPAGTRLVIVGNFRQVGGQQRQQIAMVNLDSNTLSGWFTNRFPNGTSAWDGGAYECYGVFDTAMRDVEFSPDGSYFAVATTGGAGDLNRVSLCDTVTRWSSSVTGQATEVWKNCTGGDTLLSVSVTNAAIYVGGHQRWMDNCGGRDFAVAGSVVRNGVAAVSPTTGRALSWNPGRTRGVGAEELVATSAGLYIGSDTDRLAGELRARIGMFPAG